MRHATRYLALAALGVLFSPGERAYGDADGDYALAADLYRRGQWSKAVAAFESFSRAYPRDARISTASFFLAESLMQSGEHARAQKEFKRFIAQAPRHRHARRAEFRLGEIAYFVGQNDEARRRLAAFLKAYPKDPLAAYAGPYLGQILLAAGDAPGAAAHYETSLKDHPTGSLAVDAQFGLARARESLGEFDAARRRYEQVAAKTQHRLADDAVLRLGILEHRAGRYAEAAVKLVEFEKRFEESRLAPRARYWRALSLMESGQHDQAAQLLRSLEETSHDPSLSAASQFYEGEILRRQGKLKEAAAHFEKLAAAAPPGAWTDDILLAQLRIAAAGDRHSEVDALIARMFRTHGDSPLLPYARLEHGRSLLARGQYAAAMALLEPVEKGGEGPELRAEAAYLHSLALIGAGKHDDALRRLASIERGKPPAALRVPVAAARGSALLGLGQYDKAIVQLKKFLQDHPSTPWSDRARAELAMALAAAGLFEEAARNLEQLRRSGANAELRVRATQAVARSAHMQAKFDLAAKWFGELAADATDPTAAAEGLLGRGWSQLEQGQPDEAAATLAELITKHPELAAARRAALLRAEALARSKKLDAALAQYNWLMERHGQTPEAGRALWKAAQLHEQLNQHAEAAKRLAKLLDSHRQYAAQDAELPSIDTVLYELAWAEQAAGRQTQAGAAFAALHQQYAKSPLWCDATFRLAQHRSQQGDFESAAKLVDQVLAASCREEVANHALYLQSQLAVARQDWRGVTAALEKLLAKAPRSELRPLAEFWLAESLYRQGDYESAGRRLDDLLKAPSNKKEAWRAMIPLRRAQVFAQARRWEEARQLAQTIAKEFPNFRQQFEVDYLIGRCLAAQGKFTEARQAYTRVTTDPVGRATETAAMAQWMIGETYFHQERFDDAVSAYLQLKPVYNAYPEWVAAGLLQAGKCSEQKGDWPGAVRLYAELLRNHPDTRYAADAKQRLTAAQERLQTAGT